MALLCIPAPAMHDEFSVTGALSSPNFGILLVWYSIVQYALRYDPDDAFGYLEKSDVLITPNSMQIGADLIS